MSNTKEIIYKSGSRKIAVTKIVVTDEFPPDLIIHDRDKCNYYMRLRHKSDSKLTYRCFKCYTELEFTRKSNDKPI